MENKYVRFSLALFLSLAVSVLCAYAQTFGGSLYTYGAQGCICLLWGVVLSHLYKPSFRSSLFFIPIGLLPVFGIIINHFSQYACVTFSIQFFTELICFAGGLYMVGSKKMAVSVFVAFLFGLVVGLSIYPQLPKKETVTFNEPAITNKHVDNDFTLVDKNNRPVSFSSLPQKIILVDFWFSACGVCRAKIPYIEQLNERFKNDSSILILFVNAGGEMDSYTNFVSTVTSKDWRTLQLYDQNATFCSKHHINNFPFQVIIKNGIVVFSQTGYDAGTGEQYVSKTSEVLNALKKSL